MKLAVVEDDKTIATSPRRGIRLRITALATLAVAVVMLSAGLVLSVVQEHLLTDNIDEILDSHSANLAEAVLEGRFPRVLEQQDSSDAVAQIVYADSVVIASTDNLVGERALPPPDGELQRRTLTLTIEDGHYRLLSRRVGDVVIHTGIPIDDVEEASAALRTGLAYGIPTVTLLLGLLIWWLVGRTLRPLEAMRMQVAEMSETVLEQVVALGPLIGREVALQPIGRVRIDVAGLSVSSLAEANVVGDAVQLGRLIRNLLDNAMRHAESVVRLGCVSDGNVVRLTLDDDGAGLRGLAGGTGLGLAIARDIAERHRGSIAVETSTLGGVRFVVTLPTSHGALV